MGIATNSIGRSLIRNDEFELYISGKPYSQEAATRLTDTSKSHYVPAHEIGEPMDPEALRVQAERCNDLLSGKPYK